MTQRAWEVNFDGIVGPTHNYAGLSWGNIASQKHRLSVSRPRQAALEGLAKMKFLAGLGLKQGVMLPPPRPNLLILRNVGFSGSDAEMIGKANVEMPRLLAACYSASSMWAANAATVCPSADSLDGRVHFTPANLVTQFHRSLERQFTGAMLKAIFTDEAVFAHHDPLPPGDWFCDEGAANHTRLCADYAEPGVQIFAYGRSAFSTSGTPAKFPARQTREACEALARRHQLSPTATRFIQQNPLAIDSGAFHNDVVCVGNQNVMLFHERAYTDPGALDDLRQSFESHCGKPLHLIVATEDEISLTDAVETYLFNSQLVTLADGQMSLIAPAECRNHPAAQRFLARVLADANPISSVHYVDVRQSMQNGGGPACLRLRVVLNGSQLSRVHPAALFTDQLHNLLADWIHQHYRETLHPNDLADPMFARESLDAVDELYRRLNVSDLCAFVR